MIRHLGHATHSVRTVAAGDRPGYAYPQIGHTVFSPDPLVAAVASEHNALFVSFDAGFEAITSLRELLLQRLNSPVFPLHPANPTRR